jgi:hypothetical protein
MSDDEPLCLPNPETPNSSPGDRRDEEQAQTSGGANSRAGQRRTRARPHPGRTPTPEECLAALGALPGLVALGLMSTARANSIRGAYAEILRWHGHARGQRDEGRLTDDDVLALARSNPEILSMIEPLLTDEQIEMVTGGATEQTNDGKV